MDTPALDRTGPTPLHAQIKDWIKGQIESGAWPPRFKLKAEVDLAAELNVSRGTVRKAIADLIAEGLLTQTHGRGTFVSPHVVEQPLADRLVTFSEDLISKGIPFETKVLEQAVVQAQGRVAAMLRTAPCSASGRRAVDPAQQLCCLCALSWHRTVRFHNSATLPGFGGALSPASGKWPPHLSGNCRQPRRGAEPGNGARRSSDACGAAGISGG